MNTYIFVYDQELRHRRTSLYFLRTVNIYFPVCLMSVEVLDLIALFAYLLQDFYR